jgi:hypothetical protein
MDDFNGKFCKNGSFPVIRSVKNCFDKEATKTTTTKKMATAIAANDGAKPTDDTSFPVDEFDSALSQTTPNDYDGVDETNGKKNSAKKNNYSVFYTNFYVIFSLFLKFKIF